MKLLAIRPFFWLLGILACASEALAPEGRRETEEIAEDFSAIHDPVPRWLAYELEDYVVDQRRDCFCVLGGETVRLVVRNVEVAEVVAAASGEPLPRAQFSLFF